ncbi:MAG: cell division protein FtsZ [Candidatus Hydrogenedentes bacterium]|nr:cell division protein FtsZ [Candidatus Hydrogenedentota bacterium]
MGTKFTLIDNSGTDDPNLLTDQGQHEPSENANHLNNFPQDFAGRKILIKVCGIGGAGGNAINRMIEAGMRGVDFVAINTDGQALFCSLAPIRVQIGKKNTDGLGAGCLPEVGAKSAIEDKQRIEESLRGANMVFLTAGMGGGTGTGAIPIVAEIAKNLGILTVAVVTLPFSFEGEMKINLAKKGVQQLKEFVDALIVIPNDRVADITEMSVQEAFLKVDEVLHNGIRSVTDLITRPQLLNVDFADIRTVLQKSGHAHFGIGIGKGENRAEIAVLDAVNSGLLKGRKIAGARSAILSVYGGCDLKIGEVKKAGNKLMEILGNGATIKLGAMIEKESMETIRITVIAAGFPEEDMCRELTSTKNSFPQESLNVTFSSVDIPGFSISEGLESKKSQCDQIFNPMEVTQDIINKETRNDGREKCEELFPKGSYVQAKKSEEDLEPVSTDIPSWLKRYISK